MTKVNRTFRIDKDLSKALDKICVRHGDITWHIENSLRAYLPNKAGKSIPPIDKPKGISPVPIDNGWVKLELEFDAIWLTYERKGNRKTSKARYVKLSESDRDAIFKHVPIYVRSTPEKQYRKNFEAYINQEVWNDEVVTNEKNQSSQRGQSQGYSAVDRVRESAQRRQAERARSPDSGQGLATTDGNIRGELFEAVRDGAESDLDGCLEGDYTRTD